jgi:hypothetical protein
MEFNFNHSEERVPKAIGIEEKEYEEFKDKQKKFIKNAISSKKVKTSELVEQVLPEFSYNELVLISAKFFKKIIKDVDSCIEK